MKNVIITGTTGMVGEGVLLECLNNREIAKVLSVSRKSTGYSHDKLEEYIVPDFTSLTMNDENLKGYDGCFFCAGISSIGKKEEAYARITYGTTLHFAKAVLAQNPLMVFIYVSGSGTDSTEKGKMMWARVKGKTENELMKLPFKRVYNFRPGFMKAVPGQKYTLSLYKYLGWMYPFIRSAFPNATSTLKQVTQAMIHCVVKGFDKQILEVKDINRLGKS